MRLRLQFVRGDRAEVALRHPGRLRDLRREAADFLRKAKVAEARQREAAAALLRSANNAAEAHLARPGSASQSSAPAAANLLSLLWRPGADPELQIAAVRLLWSGKDLDNLSREWEQLEGDALVLAEDVSLGELGVADGAMIHVHERPVEQAKIVLERRRRLDAEFAQKVRRREQQEAFSAAAAAAAAPGGDSSSASVAGGQQQQQQQPSFGGGGAGALGFGLLHASLSPDQIFELRVAFHRATGLVSAPAVARACFSNPSLIPQELLEREELFLRQNCWDLIQEPGIEVAQLARRVAERAEREGARHGIDSAHEPNYDSADSAPSLASSSEDSDLEVVVDIGDRNGGGVRLTAGANMAAQRQSVFLGTYKDLFAGLLAGFVFNILTVPWMGEQSVPLRAKLGVLAGMAISTLFALLYSISTNSS